MIKRVLAVMLISLVLVLSINLISADSSNSSCKESWQCSSWSSCHYGEKQRDCWDENKCRTPYNKPSEYRDCYSNYEYMRNQAIRHCDINGCYYENYPAYMNMHYNLVSDQEIQDLTNYYNSQVNANQGKQTTIQIIPVENTQYSPRGTNYSYLLNIIIIGFLAFLILVTLIVLLIISLRR